MHIHSRECDHGCKVSANHAADMIKKPDTFFFRRIHELFDVIPANAKTNQPENCTDVTECIV